MEILMKKLLALAVTAALSTSAVAGTGVFGDLSQFNKKSDDFSVSGAYNTDKKTGLQTAYRMENGLFFGAETSYDNRKATKGIEASSIGAAYRFNITDNFYVMPQVIYTKQDRDSEYNEIEVADEILGFSEFFTSNLNLGNAWEYAVQTAYHMDNGFFIAGRYGYEKANHAFRLSEYEILPGAESEIRRLSFDDKARFHTFDLTAGYEIADVALFTATYTHQRSADKMNASFQEFENDVTPFIMEEAVTANTKVNAKNNEYKLKAAYLGMGDVIPFVSYTVKGDYKFTGDAKSAPALKADNVLEVGVSVSF